MSKKIIEIECAECHDVFTVTSKALWVYKKRGMLCDECHVSPKSARYKSLYVRYASMMQRCYNIKCTSYPNYGGRGVTVCDEWKEDRTKFFEWAKANGYEPNKQIDKDIGSRELGISPATYSPETCRFLTAGENSQATRKLQSSNTSGYRGVSYVKDKEHFIATVMTEGKLVYITSNKYPVPCAIAYDNFVKKQGSEHTLNDLSGIETRAYFKHKADLREDRITLKKKLALKAEAEDKIKAIEKELEEALYPIELRENRLLSSIEAYNANIKYVQTEGNAYTLTA